MGRGQHGEGIGWRGIGWRGMVHSTAELFIAMTL